MDDMTTVELPENVGEVQVWNEYLSDDAPEPGENVGHYGLHYGGTLHRDTLAERDCYVPIPATSWGDYGGDIVGRANCAWLTDNFQEYVILAGYGGHDGQTALLKVGSEVPSYLLELIEGLRDYPLFDDEYLSDIERSVEDEDLDSYILRDIKDEIEDNQGWVDAEEHGFDDDEIRRHYYALRSSGDIRWESETATSGTLGRNGTEDAAVLIFDASLSEYVDRLTNLENHPTLM